MRKPMVLLSVLALLAGPIPAHAATAAAKTFSQSPHQVTLITGDVVTFLEGKDFVVDPAPRPNGAQVTFTGRTGETIAGVNDFYVLPSDVDSRYDRELFNITGLVREGLDHATTTPVLVQDTGRYRASKIDGRKDLKPQGKVWLNHQRKVSLDKSTAQIGAPQAWAAGFDGTGITVAVVDTGIDASHPDLADRVVAEQNFTEDPDARDYFGHGTHVASTIAGSGKASGGKYKGVAPGAKLINAKGCDGSGTCYDSWLIDAMDYAAHSGAKVINMSVGGGISDGNDPLSLEVDRLSAETGALFVVAAGNAGELGPISVGAPGAARSALTVGAVDRQDKLAYFSSRGPRFGDAGIKPDLTAPGAGIVAARAADTAMGEPVDYFYTASSGTSMATPHVAGAAAILAQQHHDWGGSRIKDALVSTAKDTGGKVLEEGAGRVDISQAHQVFGPSTVDYGRLSRNSFKLKKLRYTNDSAHPVILNLTLTGTGWNGDPIRNALITPVLAIAPHGKADALMIVNTFLAPNGSYAGIVMATGPGISLRTPVSFYIVAPTYTAQTKVLDQQGNPADSLVYLLRDDFDPVRNNDPFAQLLYDGNTAEVPAGTYSFVSELFSRSVNRRATYVALSKVDVPVRRDTSVTLDARDSVPINATASGVDTRMHNVSFSRIVRGGMGVVAGCSCANADAYATPTPAPKFGQLVLQDTWTLAQRTTVVKAKGQELHPLQDPYLINSKFPGQSTQPVVWAGDGSDFSQLDVRGKVALVGLRATDVYVVARNAIAAGATALIAFADADGGVPIPSSNRDIAYLGLSQAEGLIVKSAGSVDITANGNPQFIYNLHYSAANGVPGNLEHSVDPAQLKRTDAEYHADLPGLKVVRSFIAFRDGVGATMTNPLITLAAPARVAEYSTPTTNVTWTRIAILSGAARDQITMYNRKPFAAQDIWFAGPSSPGGFDPRNRSFFRVALPGAPQQFYVSPYMGDGSPGHLLDTDYFGYHATTYRLYRNGIRIPAQQSPYSNFPSFPVPDEPGEYRLEASTVLPASGIGGPTQTIRRLSPKTETAWTFGSQRAAANPCFAGSLFECQDVPLLQPFYDLRLSLLNTSPAGHHVIGVDVADADRLTAWYSADDGQTWQQAAVNAGHEIAIENPATGYVSLRIEAQTASGERVTQTIQRIYAIG